MIVIVNGERTDLPSGATVATLVQAAGRAPEGRGLAVAVDGEVVPRTRWGQTTLRDDAKVELVTAVQGG